MPMSERFLFCSSYAVSSIWLALKILCSLLNQSDKKLRAGARTLVFHAIPITCLYSKRSLTPDDSPLL